MTRTAVVVLLLSSALLAACTSSSAPSSSGSSRSSSPPAAIRLDGGALVAEPLAETLPADSRRAAARVLAGTWVGSGAQTPVLAHVWVEVAPPSPSAAYYGSLQRIDLPRAWVYVVPQTPVSTPQCLTSGGHFWPSPTASPVPTDASHDYAVIVDTDSGHAYLYSGAGTGPCGPSPAPGLATAGLTLSVPYEFERFTQRSAQVVITAPPCGKDVVFASVYQAIVAGHAGATARVPTGPCAGGYSKVVQNVSGRYVTSPHAPTGLMCGASYDAQVGRPADCVLMSG